MMYRAKVNLGPKTPTCMYYLPVHDSVVEYFSPGHAELRDFHGGSAAVTGRAEVQYHHSGTRCPQESPHR